MTMNPNIYSMIALGVSLLFAGAFVGGEFHRQRAMKAELKAIHEEQKRVMAEITAANQNYVEKKQILLQETAQIYQELDSILQMKQINSKQLQAARARVSQARQNVDIQSRVLENVLETSKIEFVSPQVEEQNEE